jgi:ketosteroid isomerase-like protein
MRIIACCFILAATAAHAAAPTITIPNGPPVIVHGPLPVARTLIAAEQAYAARSAAEGPAKAVRELMDPVDGLSFAGGEPARGAKAIYAANGGDKPGGTLSWVPTEVFASAGGDMGATWGHFRFQPPGSHGPVVTGKYVTVWRKSAAGWKGVIDIGTPD